VKLRLVSKAKLSKHTFTNVHANNAFWKVVTRTYAVNNNINKYNNPKTILKAFETCLKGDLKFLKIT